MRQDTVTILAAGLALAAASASAADVAFSGYGTVGYARSDRAYIYQRYLDDRGTFERDSIFGAQMDARFAPEWSATVQAKLAPSDSSDNSWKAVVSWAFLSWRPSDDWLLRAGKLRIPAFLYSENVDVGATYDFARLPAEIYGVSPISDFTGASFSKTWATANGDLTLDGYAGTAKPKVRGYLRGVGTAFSTVRIDSQGLALTYHDSGNDNTYRIDVHDATLKPVDGPTFSPIRVPIVNLGANIGVGDGFRLVGEYLHLAANVDSGINSQGGYLSLLKRMGKWTPYVTYSALRSQSQYLDRYQSLMGAGLWPLADALGVTDQHSWAVGTSYAVSPTSKLKAEWLRTRVGVASSLVDQPLGRNVSNETIDVYSLSYSFVF